MANDIFNSKQNDLRFCFQEDEDEKLEIIFYPEQSDAFYQDYKWEIVHYWLDENPEDEDTEVRFKVFEECSVLPGLLPYISTVIETLKPVSVFSIGSVDCEIQNYSKLDNSMVLVFYFFDRNTDKGIRLYMSQEKAIEFGKWCQQLDEYMKTYYPSEVYDDDI